MGGGSNMNKVFRILMKFSRGNYKEKKKKRIGKGRAIYYELV